jgi:hypothetical protein
VSQRKCTHTATEPPAHRIPLGSHGRSHDPGKRIRSSRRSHTCRQIHVAPFPRRSQHCRSFLARQCHRLESLQTCGNSHSRRRGHKDSGAVHDRKSKSHRHAEGFLRPRQGGNPRHVRRRPRKNSCLEWREDHARGLLLYIVQHIAQHLGQQIAYARRRPPVDSGSATEGLVLDSDVCHSLTLSPFKEKILRLALATASAQGISTYAPEE